MADLRSSVLIGNHKLASIFLTEGSLHPLAGLVLNRKTLCSCVPPARRVVAMNLNTQYLGHRGKRRGFFLSFLRLFSLEIEGRNSAKQRSFTAFFANLLQTFRQNFALQAQGF